MLTSFGTEKKTRLSKVYFTWVIRDFGTAEWFHSLLHAIEEQDTERRIEITIYLTAKIKDDDMNNILVQDVGAERDAITSLRSPTNFGRPNWDRTFQGIADQHPDTDCGVFFVSPCDTFGLNEEEEWMRRLTGSRVCVCVFRAVRPSGAVEAAAPDEQQVHHTWRDQVLLRKRELLACPAG